MENKEACGNCRFAKGFAKPDPLPAPVQRSILWGLFKWEDGPDELNVWLHDIRMYTYENRVECRRFAEIVEKPKVGWCGEYQRREDQ